MTRLFGLRLFTCLAVILIAVFSVVSAARMAPDRDTDAEVALMLATGATAADLCGEAGMVHDHHCPFCCLLSHLPRTEPALREVRLLVRPIWQDLQALLTAPQTGNPNVSARAPPALA